MITSYFQCKLSLKFIFISATCMTHVGSFACGGNTSECVSKDVLCDGKQNCLDNSDESYSNCGESIVIDRPYYKFSAINGFYYDDIYIILDDYAVSSKCHNLKTLTLFIYLGLSEHAYIL